MQPSLKPDKKKTQKNCCLNHKCLFTEEIFENTYRIKVHLLYILMDNEINIKKFKNYISEIEKLK